MPLPVIIAGALGALATSVSAVLKFADNPLIAYILVIGLVLADSGVSGFVGFQGITGFILTQFFSAVGVPIYWYSWEVLIILGILPIVLHIFTKS
jgi:hypothetical protein